MVLAFEYAGWQAGWGLKLDLLMYKGIGTESEGMPRSIRGQALPSFLAFTSQSKPCSRRLEKIERKMLPK